MNKIDFTHDDEDIEFVTDDNYLEINTWNSSNEQFTIILDPKEIDKLREFLKRNYEE
jgi:hypothetical protein